MKETVTIASNAVSAKLHEASREVKLEVQRTLSYAVEGAEHSDLFKQHRWDGRSSFLDFRTGLFPAGFVHFVSANLRRKGYEVRLVRKPFPLPLGPENPKIDAFPEDPRYDYQMEVVRRLVKHGQIIAQVATGGGKSRIARLAYARINRPTLFLTTRGILMYQMRDTFEKDLGVACNVLGDGQFGHIDAAGRERVSKKMSVGMVQTLVSRLAIKTVEGEFEAQYDALKAKQLKEYQEHEKSLKLLRVVPALAKVKLAELDKEHEREVKREAERMKREAERRVKEQDQVRANTINLLSKFELVILEEAHEASGNSYYEILQHCKNAHYRLALTGTPFMKDDEEANMRLMASSGPIAIKVSEKMLIDRGILAQPYFKTVKLKVKPAKLHRMTAWQAAYRLGIVENAERNQAIVNEVSRATAYGLSSMVLVQHKKHGENLLEAMQACGLRAEFIQGADDQEGRKRALERLGKRQIDVLIGTTILDVGVDVPAVGLIVLAGGGKAEVALRQRIGRGLRAKKSGPNVAMIVDFDDPFNDHTKKHALERARIVAETEGFAENILPGDFDYTALGFERKAA